MNDFIKNKCGWAVLILCILNLAVIGISFFRPHHPPPPPPLPELLAKKLGFSPEQKEQMMEIDRQQHIKGDDLYEQMGRMKRRMVELTVLHPQDSVALDSVITASDRIHTALNRHQMDYYGKIKVICTPEQQKKLDEIFLSLIENPE